MTVEVQPDTEAAVRTYLKAALLPDVLGGRVFYSVPSGTPALPLVTVGQVSGGPQEGETPMQSPRLSFSCWAKNKKEASDVKRALVGLLRRLDSVALDAETWCYGVTFISELWLPDDDAKLARYVVDATFTVTSLAS